MSGPAFHTLAYFCECAFFFEEGYFHEVSLVKPVKFTRDSGCQARDEFLVIFKGIIS